MAHRGAADPSVSPLLLLILLLLPQGSSEESRPRGATLLPKDRATLLPKVWTALLPKVRAALLPKVRAALLPKVRAALLPKDRAALLPKDRAALLPKDRAALLPKDRAALLPKDPADLLPKHRAALLPKDRATLLPKDRAALLPKDRAALLPKDRAALLPKVRACPHGMFWSSEGCTHCNCDPSEVVRPQCDSDGRCKCSGRVLDSTCRSCPNGTLGSLASCQPCFCNGHSRACTSSGFCIDCGGNTTGPRCEHCLPGFYHPPGSLITMPCTKEECCPPWITPPSNSETPQTLQLMAAKKGMNKKSGRQFPAWDLPTVPPLMREGEVLHTTNLGPTNGISKIKSGVIKVFNNRTSQGMEAAQATMLSEVQRLSTMLITPFRGKVRMDKAKITTERAKWETIETSTAKGTAMALSISVQKHATNTTRENHAQKAQPSSKVNMDTRLTTVERVKMTELEKALNATGRNAWATLATEGAPLIADGSVAEGMGLTTVGKEVEAVPITAGKVAKATAMTAAGRVMEGAASNAEGINVGAAPTAEGRMEVGTSPRAAGRSEVALATQGRVVMGVATTVPRREAGTSSVGASTTTKGRMETRAAQTAEGELEVGAAPTTEARGEVGAGLTEEGRPTLTVKGRWEEALTTAKRAEVAMTIATMSTRLKIGPTLRVTSPSKHAKETSTSETSPTKSVLKTTTEFLTPPPMMLLPNGGCGELNQCSTDFSQSLSSPNATVPHGREKHREPAVPATKILTTDFKFNADEKLVAISMKNTSSNTALIDGLLNNFAPRTAIGQGIHTTSVQTEQRSDSETNGFQPSVSDISSTSQTLEGWFREMTGMSRNAEFHRTVGMSTAHPVSMLMEPWTTASTVKTEIPTLQVITQTTSTMEQISVSQAPELSSQVNTVVRKVMTATTSHSTIPPGQDTSPRSGFKHKTEVITQPSFGRGQEIDNQKEDPLRGNDRPSMIVVSITVAAVAVVAVLGIGTFGIITFLRRRRRQKQSLPFWTIELKADATSLTSERDCLPHADASGLLEGAPDAEKRVGADIRLADSVEQSPTTHGWLFGCDTQASLIV